MLYVQGWEAWCEGANGKLDLLGPCDGKRTG